MPPAEPLDLQRQPSWSNNEQRPVPGAWCNACRGERWWTERLEPNGWRCMLCHPPDHLPAEAIRREGEAEDALVPAAPASLRGAEPAVPAGGHRAATIILAGPP